MSSARSHLPPGRKPRGLDGASRAEQLSLFAGIDGKETKPSPQAVEESDAVVVPRKSSNLRVTPREKMEGRTAAKGNAAAKRERRTQRRSNALVVVERIGQRAERKDGERFNNLLSHLTVPLLREAYASLNKRAATGVDRVTWHAYSEGLEKRLVDLENRIQRGSYRPQPVLRVLIPKGDGRMRPLGLPSLEDKIVQQAVRWLMEAIYEQEFVGFSYGFRPRRSAHKALDALLLGLTSKSIGHVLDADIQAFFDNVDHAKLLAFLELKIADRRLLRLVEQWLKAGVMTSTKQFEDSERGTPQGGLISPLLANIYLHYVLDRFVQQWRHRQAHGEVIIVRYADDFVIGCSEEHDVNALHAALQERLREHGLTLHPEKTRVIEFGLVAARRRHWKKDPAHLPTFDFLGFTHVTIQRSRGQFAPHIVRLTSRKKRTAKLKALRQELRRRRHDPMREQHAWIASVVRGHEKYYAVVGNRHFGIFRHELRQAWINSLQRRSQRSRWTAADYARFDRQWALPKRPPRRRPQT